jgi:transcriptional regulator with XRE-family HTH domain
MMTVVIIAIWELSLPESRHNDADLRGLARAVRRMREQLGMSAEELADATDMSRQRIDALEDGRLDPTYEQLLALAEGLDTQVSVLVALAARLKKSGEP